MQIALNPVEKPMCPFSIWCFVFDSFYYSDLKPVHAAVPSVQIAAHFVQGIEYSIKKPFNRLKNIIRHIYHVSFHCAVWQRD